MGLFRPYEQTTATDETHQGGARTVRRPRTGSTRADLLHPDAAVSPTPQVEPSSVSDPRPSPMADPRPSTSPAGQTRRTPQKKGTRTPTRAEAEAARMARLHPTLSPKEQKKAQREMERQARMRSLDAVESAPDRALLRDHIDAHFSPAELTMPLMLVMILCMFAFQGNFTVQAWLSYILMALFVVFLISFVLTWRGFRRIAEERGISTTRRGLRMYMVNRMMALRRMRRPEPRVQRGASY